MGTYILKFVLLQMGKTSKDWMRSWRERLARDKNKKDEYLHKERIRDKTRREIYKTKVCANKNLLKEKRAKDAERQRKCREKKMEKKKEMLLTDSTSNLGSYKCPQSLGKAVSRIKKTLPKSPQKKSAVMKKLITDEVPSLSKKLFQRSDISRHSWNKICTDTERKVLDFYLRNDVSRQAPGKRDVKSVKDPVSGIRKSHQKHHMLMTIKEAYTLFSSENPDIHLSKSKFFELRPQHVLPSSLLPHNVCVCRYHANFDFILCCLRDKIDDFPENSHVLLDKICCCSSNEKCMTNVCNECDDKILEILPKDPQELSENVTYKQWCDVEGRLKVMVNEETVEDACTELQNQLPIYKKHCFVKKVQGEYFEKKKLNLSEDDIVIQIDFAENYSNVAQDEIQSAHWTHDQITVFTCCAWSKNKTNSYVVVSDDLSHDKFAVWTFLKEIINKLKEEFTFKNVILFSDGCAAQFKNKFTLSNLCFFKKDFGVEGEWNFFATSHGKGAVDGIGGTVKRIVWLKVKERRVIINNAEDFHRCAATATSKIQMLYVSSADVEKNKAYLRERWEKVKSIPGLQGKHFFAPSDQDHLVTAVTVRSVKDKYLVFQQNETLQVKSCQQSSRLKYHDVYSSDSEDDCQATDIHPGSYVLAQFESLNKKRKCNYVCVCQNAVDDNGEVKVMALKMCDKGMGKIFKMDEEDISYISLGQILKILNEPAIKVVGDRVFYEFEKKINNVFAD